MQKIYLNKSGYSIILSILMIGFLMILTTGVFNLVLRELKDNKGELNYLKASEAVIGSSELALLKIKEKGYSYQDKIEDDVNDRSIVLANNPTDKTKFHPKKDIYISYDLDYTVDSYDGVLKPAGYDIIPLFFSGATGGGKVANIDLTINSSNSSYLSWNIIGKDNGISGVGEFKSSTKGKGRLGVDFSYGEEEIGNFLTSSDFNYLVLVNLDPSLDLEYTLKSHDSGKFFTKPRTDIKASAVVGDYRQNLEISFDNTEFLKMLRYSIYGN